MNALERLEAWKSGHKARSVKINIDDGYGANCWEVELWGQGKKKEGAGGYVYAAECAFFESDKPLPNYVVYLHDGNDDADWDWPGLDAVINAAIDKAEELGL